MLKRLDGTSRLIARFRNTRLAHQRELLRLAGVEVGDAIRVLSGVPNLDASALSSLDAAQAQIAIAQATPTEAVRVSAIATARAALLQASSQVGSRLDYAIGDGSLMF